MGTLIFNGGKQSIKRVSKVQRSIDGFLKAHPGTLRKHDHSTLRRLLKKRAKVLSKATGMQVHSLFD